MMLKKMLCTLALLMTASFAYGQSLTFTAQTTTGNGSVVPVLTWATSPAANSCTASGDAAWTGSKAVSGTTTLAAITGSKTYNMSCSWSGQTVSLHWTLPTLNTDGTPYTDPKNIKVLYGNTGPSEAALTQSTLLGPTVAATTLGPFTVGTWYFGLKAINLSDKSSDLSTVVSKTISTNATDTKAVSITVNPIPMAPTGFIAD